MEANEAQSAAGLMVKRLLKVHTGPGERVRSTAQHRDRMDVSNKKPPNLGALRLRVGGGDG